MRIVVAILIALVSMHYAHAESQIGNFFGWSELANGDFVSQMKISERNKLTELENFIEADRRCLESAKEGFADQALSTKVDIFKMDPRGRGVEYFCVVTITSKGFSNWTPSIK